MPQTMAKELLTAIMPSIRKWQSVPGASPVTGPPSLVSLPAVLINGADAADLGQMVIVGDQLHTDDGGWTNSPAFTYQWAQDGVAIAGATTPDYVVQPGDIGHILTCRVTATNALGSAYANTVQLYGLDVPGNTTPPNIIALGDGTVGDTLVPDAGVWTNAPTSYAYQWLRDSANIPGATAASYVLVALDGGHTVGCLKTAFNRAGPSAPVTCNGAIAVPGRPVNTTAPRVTGNSGGPGIGAVGDVLTCDNGTWTNNPTSFTFQWYHAPGGQIAGATGATYTVTAADSGLSLVCNVVAHNSAGASVQASSATIAVSGVMSERGGKRK